MNGSVIPYLLNYHFPGRKTEIGILIQVIYRLSALWVNGVRKVGEGRGKTLSRHKLTLACLNGNLWSMDCTTRFIPLCSKKNILLHPHKVSFYYGLWKRLGEYSEGQRGLTCCSPLGCKESDMTERLNNDRKVESSRLSQPKQIQVTEGTSVKKKKKNKISLKQPTLTATDGLVNRSGKVIRAGQQQHLLQKLVLGSPHVSRF